VNPLRFEIMARSPTHAARLGALHTPHGTVHTPAFMPVGTRASVRGILPSLLHDLGAQIILNNSYHLMLRPGSDLIKSLGGVHAFMNWHGPILSDSGGYQAFSLADSNSVDDDGVTFKSHIDGSTVRLTPERAIHEQNALGPDIIMPLDDCPPTLQEPGPKDPDARPAPRRPATTDAHEHLRRLDIANERTIRWLERCKAAHQRPGDQALFGIVQGGTDLARREWSASRVAAIDLPGYAIGGVAVGEPPDHIARVVRHTAPLLPNAKPRYLMGVGYERDLLAAVLAGVDMFDCVLPTRNGRNANAFTPTGQVRLRNLQFARDDGPIDPACDCPACSPTGGGRFSRAYLRHLFMAGEMLAPILVSLHNLRHFQRFMSEVRLAIPSGDWAGLVVKFPVAAEGL
jgi:queuine tRNA-ribosyltransferase